MEYVSLLIGLFFVGLLVGGIAAGLFVMKRYGSVGSDAQKRAAASDSKIAALDATVVELRKQCESALNDIEQLRAKLSIETSARVKAETERKDISQQLEDEKRLLAEAENRLKDTFEALASTTLKSNTDSFLTLAKSTLEKLLTEAKGDLGKRQEAISGLVTPLADSLKQFEEHVRVLEKSRQEAYTGLEANIRGMVGVQEKLERETANLVTALRTPSVRGKWGELTLERVVELAGMVDHCDFSKQKTASDDEGGRVRPDLVVHLHSGRDIVVDSKVPFAAYLEAIKAESEEVRKDLLIQHAAQLRTHMQDLAGKNYWAQFPNAPEFVIMFIPGESFLSAAALVDQTLIEDGLAKRVIVATPTTLIAVLLSIAYGWRQALVAKNAQEISEMGKQLYDRMRIFADHMTGIGGGLETVNKAYNSAVGSLESRVLPSAKRFKELGAASGEDIGIVKTVETQPRQVSIPESTENLKVNE
jgi:DNA recombination protein RmuC